jgi:hypothetical protein
VILVDTSAWVEYDRAKGSPVERRLTQLIAADDQLAVTEPVIMEVTAGARSDDREDALRRLLCGSTSCGSTRWSTSTPPPASIGDAVEPVSLLCHARGASNAPAAYAANCHQAQGTSTSGTTLEPPPPTNG